VGVAARAPPHRVRPRHPPAIPPPRHDRRRGAAAVWCTSTTTSLIGGFPAAQPPAAASANAMTLRTDTSVSESADAAVLGRRSVRTRTQRRRSLSNIPADDRLSPRAAAPRHHSLHRPGRGGTLSALPHGHLATLRRAPPTGPPAKVSVSSHFPPEHACWPRAASLPPCQPHLASLQRWRLQPPARGRGCWHGGPRGQRRRPGPSPSGRCRHRYCRAGGMLPCRGGGDAGGASGPKQVESAEVAGKGKGRGDRSACLSSSGARADPHPRRACGLGSRR